MALESRLPGLSVIEEGDAKPEKVESKAESPTPHPWTGSGSTWVIFTLTTRKGTHLLSIRDKESYGASCFAVASQPLRANHRSEESLLKAFE